MDKKVECEKSTAMSDEERLALAAKLDKELDEWIDGLEKRQYTEGWPEDRWEAEMDRHPFFMKKAPEPGEELHPLLEGIQQLKYDPEENTAEELAVSYKEDGNFNYKHKNYRLAIMAYTEGLRQRHDNVELRAALYNNRAAAHEQLQNNRSSLRDCEAALRLRPAYGKARERAARCCAALGAWPRCQELCAELLAAAPGHAAASALLRRAAAARKEAALAERREQREARAAAAAEQGLRVALERRGVRVEGGLEPVAPGLAGARVHEAADGRLVWPLALVFPEHGSVDAVRAVAEDEPLGAVLGAVLAEPAAWDPRRRYTPAAVQLYAAAEPGAPRSPLLAVDARCSLRRLLAERRVAVLDGTPALYVVVRGSPYEQHLCAGYASVTPLLPD